MISESAPIFANIIIWKVLFEKNKKVIFFNRIKQFERHQEIERETPVAIREGDHHELFAGPNVEEVGIECILVIVGRG